MAGFGPTLVLGSVQRSSPYGQTTPQTGHANVFIGSLQPNVTTDDLQMMFAEYGTIVSCKVPMGPDGASKGMGFVRYSSRQEAQSAIDALAGKDGMLVKFADNDGVGPRPAQAQAQAGPVKAIPSNIVLQVRYAGADQAPSENLYIGGIPSSLNAASLQKLIEDFGLKVVRCKVMPDTRGVGFTSAMAQLASQEEAATAIEYLQGQQSQSIADLNAKAQSVGVLRVVFAGKDSSIPSDNLYISGIPPTVDQQLFSEMFTGAGFNVMRVKILPDRGMGSCVGMVQLQSVEEAEAAIAAFNGQEVVGPETFQPRPAASVGAAGGEAVLQVKFAGPDASVPSDNLYINNVPASVGSEDLKGLFESLGFTVSRIRVTADTRGVGRVSAMVQVGSVEQAHEAIAQLNGQKVQAPEGAKAATPVVAAQAKEGVLNVKYSGAGAPGDNLYITGLPASIDLETVTHLFTSNGFQVVRARLTAPGVALVQLTNLQNATAAIAAFNGQSVEVDDPMDGSGAAPPAPAPTPAPLLASTSVISLARAPVVAAAPVVAVAPVVAAAPAPAAAAADGTRTLSVKFHGPAGSPSDKLHVTNLPGEVDPDTLDNMFTGAGFNIKWSKLMADTRTNTASAMVQLASATEAFNAIQMFDGQSVAVDGAGGAPPAAVPTPTPARAPVPAAVVQATPVQIAPIQLAPVQSAPLHSPPVQVVIAAHTSAFKKGFLSVSYAGKDHAPSDNLYMMGLPTATTTDALNQMFSEGGFSVKRSRVLPDTKGAGYCCAMVQVATAEQAAGAIQAFNDQPIALDDAGGSPPPAQATTPKAAVSLGGAGGAAQSTLLVKYQGDGVTPVDNLFIQGLPSSIDQQTLNKTFQDLGLHVVRSRVLPGTRGFGNCTALVQLASVQEAQVAIEQLNGRNVAAPAGAGAGAAPPAAAAAPATPFVRDVPGVLSVKYSGSGEPSDNLYIGGLPGSTIDQESLTGLFQSLGLTVLRVKVLPDTRGAGHCKAMVQLASREEAAKAIEDLHGREISSA